MNNLQTGFLDFGWWQYAPDLGRWFGIDQLAEAYDDTSPYAYVKNNPLSFIDPDGRCASNAEGNFPSPDCATSMEGVVIKGKKKVKSAASGDSNIANPFPNIFSFVNSSFSGFGSPDGGGGGGGGYHIRPTPGSGEDLDTMYDRLRKSIFGRTSSQAFKDSYFDNEWATFSTTANTVVEGVPGVLTVNVRNTTTDKPKITPSVDLQFKPTFSPVSIKSNVSTSGINNSIMVSVGGVTVGVSALSAFSPMNSNVGINWGTYNGTSSTVTNLGIKPASMIVTAATAAGGYFLLRILPPGLLFDPAFSSGVPPTFY